MTPPINTLPEGTPETPAEQPSRIAQILTGTKLTLLAAVVAGGIAGKPHEAQAQETFEIQPAVYIIPYDDFQQSSEQPMSEVEYNELLDEMTADILQRQEAGTDEIEPGVTIANVLEAIRIIGDDALFTSFVGFYAGSKNSAFAAEEIFEKMTDAQKVPAIHAEAINYAREIYVENMITLDPQYTEGRLSRAPEDEKRIRAARNFNDILRDVIAGNNLSLDSLVQLAQYAQPFVQDYLLHPEFSEEFPQAALTEAIELIRMREETAAMREETAAMREETIQRFQQLAQEIKKLRTGGV